MEAEFSHLPVMVREVVELFLPVPDGLIVDCTVGGAGHATAVLGARPDLHLLGIDRDADAVLAARSRLAPFGERAQVVEGGFEQLAELVDRYGKGARVMGILMDLGVSSPQLDRPERGFSYRFDAPLDMRMDAKQAVTAADVVNGYDMEELADVIARNGEERFARRIARGIVAARPLDDDARARRRDPRCRSRRPRGATVVIPPRRTFQAIRMEVNRELPNLADGLDDSVHVIGPQGRVLVLAYHSLEDRMVKEKFADWADTGSVPALPKLAIPEPKRNPLVRLLTRRPLRPRADEVAANRRAESVRLRVVERLPDSA